MEYKNLQNTERYIINNRNEKLHTRHFYTDKYPPKAIIICLHGYGSHINRIIYKNLYENLTNNGYSFIGLDFHGHGYSDGERALVKNYVHLIDDALCLLLDIFTNIPNRYGFQVPQVFQKKTPFYIMGHSMGGSIAILTSLLLNVPNTVTFTSTFYKENKDTIQTQIAPFFKGTILLCPAVELINLPFVNTIVNQLSFSYTSNYSIPKFIFDESKYNSSIWSCPKYLKYIEDDGFPNNPNGIGYGGNIKFGTLCSILKLSETVKKNIERINFPFIVMHDSIGDIIVKSSGSKLLIDNSKSRDRIYIEIKDGLHDILANKKDETIKHILKWLNK
jgi:alpha-beta hydrolase superfamily lysophospholipase